MNKDEMIKEVANLIYSCQFADDCTGGHCDECLATALINLGYRKIADDEQVIKTEQLYETLNSTLESGKRMGYAQGRDETAREILHKTKDYIENSVGGYLLIDRKGIRELANALGIELE